MFISPSISAAASEMFNRSSKRSTSESYEERKCSNSKQKLKKLSNYQTHKRLIILKAYIPSASEYDNVWSKFRAYMGAKLSKKAKNNGTWENDTFKTGYFFLRSALVGSSNGVYYGNAGGTRASGYSGSNGAGLRVAFNLIYNPECNLVKGCKQEKRTAVVYENGDGGPVYDGNGKTKEITSNGDIITLANGTKCLWLNREECERGEAKTMQFWTLNLVDCAVPFDENGNHNDWSKATKLQNQCENWLKENLSEEEKKMVVPVEMSDKNGYEKATILDTETEIAIAKNSHLTIEQKVDMIYHLLYSQNTQVKEKLEQTNFIQQEHETLVLSQNFDENIPSLKNAFIAYKKGKIDSQAFMQVVDKIQPKIEEEQK